MKFDTKLLHAGHNPKEHQMCINVPIYPTTAFDFDDVERGAGLFDLKVEGDIYTRLSNPTNNILEKRLAELEGGVGALAFSSGQAATTAAILNITNSGDEVVAASTLYGGTCNLFSSTFKKLGINVKFAKGEEPEDFEREITEKTRCIFIELLSNPALNIIDIEKLADVAHRHNVPLIVDNTIPSPYLCRPIEWGADIVVHSTTKYISGHGNAMGGAIIDSGNFDWNVKVNIDGKILPKYPELTEPDESYHGIVYTESFGKVAYIVKARAQILRDMGACPSPFNSYLTISGLETLSLRMQRHCDSALKIAEWLENHPSISWVNYPGLKSSKYYELAKKYMPKGCSSIIGFGLRGKSSVANVNPTSPPDEKRGKSSLVDISPTSPPDEKGGASAGEKFINSLTIPIHTTNIGDTRSIITYPYLTTHRQLSDEQKIACGVTDDFMRFSVGLEDVEDIIEDLDQAIRKSQCI